MDFKQIMHYPRYILKFGMCLFFILFPVIAYFMHARYFPNKTQQDIFLALTFLYGVYRFIRTYNEYKSEIKEDKQFKDRQ